MKQALVNVYPFNELSGEAKDKAWVSYKDGLSPYNQMEYALLADQFGWHYLKDGTYYGDILTENEGKPYPEWEEIG